MNKVIVGAIGGALLGGVVVGMLLRPVIAPDARIGEAETKAAEADKAAATHKARADGLDKDVEKLTSAKHDVETKLAEAEKAQTKLAETAADADKRAKGLDAAKQKLAGVSRGVANVTVEGDAIHVLISDSILFPGSTSSSGDALTDRGKQVLGKLATALKDMPDKQIMVQGHTDDRPVAVVQVKAAPAAPPKKGQKPAPPPPPPPPPRIPTNWELSGLRALAVVHYLQDVSKIDAGRLGAEAFSQYRPISRTNKAANRRIELVLSPKPKK